MRLLNRRRGLAGILLIVAVLTPGYLRAFVIHGDSDAPALITGDRVLVNLAAYDIRWPYSEQRLVKLRDPAPGDLVLVRLADGRLVVKRVVAGPGTRIEMHDDHLAIDGVELEYVAVEPGEAGGKSLRGRLDEVIEVERGNGPEVTISHGRNDEGADGFEEQSVPEDMYFVLGSNRDVSVDSRHFGPVPRDRILGKVIGDPWILGHAR